MSKNRTKYSKEFKVETVHLALDEDVTIKSVVGGGLPFARLWAQPVFKIGKAITD